MIRLTRLNHQAIAVNTDLIKWIESSPDTVISLITGEKLVVLETCDQVIAAIHALRRQIAIPVGIAELAALRSRCPLPGDE